MLSMRKEKSRCLDMGFVMKNYIKLNLISFDVNNKGLDNCLQSDQHLYYSH